MDKAWVMYGYAIPNIDYATAKPHRGDMCASGMPIISRVEVPNERVVRIISQEQGCPP